MSVVRDILLKIYLPYQRSRLKNKTFSLMCNNCNGGFLLHDLALPFLSPTINLYIPPRDFVRLMGDLDKYLHLSFVEKQTQQPYPVGMLGDVEIHFVHYRSFEEGVRKWSERATRLRMDNIFVMMTERDGCTLEDLQAFDALPYRNKVVFTYKTYPQIKSSFPVYKGICGLFAPRTQNGVGYLYEYFNKGSPLRLLYRF